MVSIASTLVSNSTQLDNIDLQAGPQDFTITGATLNEGAEQPLSVRLAEFNRDWKPGLTVRRVLFGLWGDETDDWIGRRVRLFRDETVTFGRDKTGGTRISHASHISKTMTLTLPISKGKFGQFTVEPLPDAPAPSTPTGPTAEQVAASTDVDALKAAWESSPPDIQALIVERVAELEKADDPSVNEQWDQPAIGADA